MSPRLLAAAALHRLRRHRVSLPARAAQDIEPRTYSNAPIGVNFVIAGYAYTRGALQFDSALDLTDAHLKTSNAVVGYARVFDLGGQSATIGVVVPYTGSPGTPVYQGDPVERNVNGFANPALRLCANLYGAPALALKEFRAWQQDAIVGACFTVSAPWSQYDSSRLVNIGTNRWTFKPELGISKTAGPWTLEASAGATIFTVNKDFFGGNRREQDPVYSVQGHTIYGFRGGSWAIGRRDLLRRGTDHLQRNPEGRPAAELARRGHVRDAGGPAQLDQALCEPRRSPTAPATASTWSASRGSTAGAEACNRAIALRCRARCRRRRRRPWPTPRRRSSCPPRA